MYFALSDEQHQLRDVARDFFARYPGTVAARDYLDGVIDSIPDMAGPLGSMGFLGVLADESIGGTGGTVTDLTVIAEQAGRHLAASPLISAAAQAIPLLAAAAGLGSKAGREVLESVLAGEHTVAVLDPQRLRFDGDRICGSVAATPYGATADSGVSLIDDRLVVLRLDDAASVQRRNTGALDPTRELAALNLNGACATGVLDDPVLTQALWRRARALGMLTLAAECSGVVEAALRLGVDYAKQRHAFGRPIGSFQAVKHMLVDTYVLAEQLRSLVWLAAARADMDEDFSWHAAGALAYGLDAAADATDVLVQVHGGIGVTWEHDAHLYWRRARTDRSLFGDSVELRHSIATGLIANASDRERVSV